MILKSEYAEVVMNRGGSNFKVKGAFILRYELACGVNSSPNPKVHQNACHFI